LVAYGNQAFNILVDGRADAFDPGYFGDVCKSPVLLAVVNDGLSLAGANAGQGLQEPGFGSVYVYLLGLFWLRDSLAWLWRGQVNLYGLGWLVFLPGDYPAGNNDGN
jgi:hypothetical protein